MQHVKFDLRGSDSITQDLKKRMNHFLKKAKLRHSRQMDVHEFREFAENRLPDEIKGFDQRKKPSAVSWRWSASGRIDSKERLFSKMKSAGFGSDRRNVTVSIGYLPERSEYFMVVKGKWKGKWRLVGQEGEKYQAEVVGPLSSQEEFQEILKGIDWR